MTPEHALSTGILDTLPGRALATGVLVAEVSPLNEIARYALLGGALYATDGNSLAAAAVYGGATFLLEGSAALVAGPVITETKFAPLLERVTRRVDSMGISVDALSNKVVKAGAAIYGGAAISMCLEKITDPEISKQELTKRGLKISTGLGILCCAEGALIAEGIAHPQPETIGAAALAVGGMLAFGKWVHKKFKGNNDSPTIQAEHLQPNLGGNESGLQEDEPEATAAQWCLDLD